MWCVLQGSQRGGGEEVPHWEQDQGRLKARPRPLSPAGPAEGTGTSEGFSQPGSSDLPRPRLPSTSALRRGARPAGGASPRAQLRPEGRGSPAAGPAGAVPACLPSVPPQTRRRQRGRAGRPGAGGDRRLLAAAVPPSPWVGAGERQPAPGRCRGEMLVRDAA